MFQLRVLDESEIAMTLKKIVGMGAIAGALGFSAIGLAGVANATPAPQTAPGAVQHLQLDGWDGGGWHGGRGYGGPGWGGPGYGGPAYGAPVYGGPGYGGPGYGGPGSCTNPLNMVIHPARCL
jgi:hypothetical protein